MSGGLREYEEAAKILDEARRRLYAVLAGDQARGTTSGPVEGQPGGTPASQPSRPAPPASRGPGQPERRPCSRASMISGPGTKSPSGGKSSILSSPRRSSNIGLVP